MRYRSILLLLLIMLSAGAGGQSHAYTSFPGCWNPDSLGNHRVVVRFTGVGGVAHASISWRRRDPDPAAHRIIVQDAANGARITNVVATNISRESGQIFFQPGSGKGNYYIYYLPYKNEGASNYPKGIYWKPDTTAEPEGVGKLDKNSPG